MLIPSKYLTEEIKREYQINNLQHNDSYVYCKIQNGMYGLKQAVCFAYKHLVKKVKMDTHHLSKHQIYGITPQQEQNFVCALTTFALSTFPPTTEIISTKHSEKTMISRS